MTVHCAAAIVLAAVVSLDAQLDSRKDAAGAATPPSASSAPATVPGGAPLPSSEPAALQSRTALNLLGQTDTRSGESRRNENVQFNLIDNNAQKELNQRIGTTATIVTEFQPERNYYGAEYGTPPSTSMLLAPSSLRQAWHGNLSWTHQNSATTARAFFQVGPVLPGRDNSGSFSLGGPVRSNNTNLLFEGSSQRIRSFVNGNILVPLPGERTPLATDPIIRAYVQRIIDSYPNILPNRPDIDARMLNTNSPQKIGNDSLTARIDHKAGERDRIVARHSWLTQEVHAFQLYKGQNPDTSTRSHRSFLGWTRSLSPSTIVSLGAGFDRVHSLITPEVNALGPQVFVSQIISPLNANNPIPIDRVQNSFRYAAQVRMIRGAHQMAFGAETVRRQLNGREHDSHLGAISFFANTFNGIAYDSMSTMRMGLPSNYFIAVGDIHRGYRNWDTQFFAGDKYTRGRLVINYGANWRPISRPVEVNYREQVPVPAQWGNVGPQLGLAYRLKPGWGVWRAAYAIHYGEIFPVTFQQVRFNPPNNFKYVVQNAPLLNPLVGIDPSQARPVLYGFEDHPRTPYSQQYNASWELEPFPDWRAQLGYTGSRAVKLLHSWYLNRAHPVAGIALTTATINDRRLRQDVSEIRRITNSSRGYFDAFRAALTVPRWRGANLEASYWFSKSVDLGGDYLNTANDVDAFRNRPQNEYGAAADSKGRSRFDQPHAFLLRANYAAPRFPGRARKYLGDWSLNGVALSKSGTPFNLSTGSDAPGFGNVDGVNSDRPNIADPSILGRTISHPDVSRELLPRSAFTFIVPGEPRGNLGRNVFRRASIRNLNAGLSTAWALKREMALTFRAESVNLTNTPQFAEPGYTLSDPQFGVITNTLNDGRAFRFSLNLAF